MERISRIVETIIGDYPGERQIRRPISCLYGTLAISSGVLILAVFSLPDALIYLLMALVVLPYGLLTFRNDRVSYDEAGITLYNLWGKPYQKRWKEICKIDVVEEPLISRHLATGRVLRIYCIEKRGTVAIYRYPYKFYICIDDFLSFVDSDSTEQYLR